MSLIQHTLETPYPVGPVHCYSGELGGELVLFDTGPPTARARDYLVQSLDLQRLRHLIVTHCHIDHYGLAAWLEETTGVQVWLPYRDALKIRRHHERLDLLDALLASYGFSREFVAGFRVGMSDGTVFPQFPQRFRVIEEELPEQLGLTVLSCPGHSQSDLVFAGGGWAVTGDVMLRGIFQSPLLDVDLETGERFQNYRAYCGSLLKLATLRQKRILPGHRESISGVDASILFYVEKLLERARKLREFSEETNLARVVNSLFGDYLQHDFHVFLKASEIVFMRDFLREPELLRGVLAQIGLLSFVNEQFVAVAA
jgi:hydroxyacylglutathione hydrolase